MNKGNNHHDVLHYHLCSRSEPCGCDDGTSLHILQLLTANHHIWPISVYFQQAYFFPKTKNSKVFVFWYCPAIIIGVLVLI